MCWRLLLCGSFVAACSAPAPPRPPRDPALRELPLSFYPAADTTTPPRALVFFFGNDVGFWQPHQQLAWAISKSQIAVVGLDMRDLLNALPDDGPARDSAFVAAILPLIARCRHELQSDTVPLILAGHSLGAEVALWTAAFARPSGTIGVLAMSPGSRSHLRVSLSDIAMTGEPTGPGSFLVAEAVRRMPAHERLAIVRGQRDRFAFADSAILAAGGARAARYGVAFSGHSLKGIVLERPTVRRALGWILQHGTGPRGS